jgi:hypothetical protein
VCVWAEVAPARSQAARTNAWEPPVFMATHYRYPLLDPYVTRKIIHNVGGGVNQGPAGPGRRTFLVGNSNFEREGCEVGKGNGR